jgi:IS5 family transposase
MAELRRELLRNGRLRILVGISSVSEIPSEDSPSRFFARLAELGDEVDQLHVAVIAQIRELHPETDKHVAIDSTAINAWANGNRSQPADQDASWGCKGHKEKGESAWWFGYKEHLAVDTRAELVLVYKTTTASESDAKNLSSLLEKLDDLLPAGHLEAVMADAQYDSQANHEAIWARRALPLIDHNDRGWRAPTGYTKDGCPLCDCARTRDPV